MQQILPPKRLTAFLAVLRKTNRLAITSDSVSVLVDEEPQTPVASETTALVKKYEIGSGENRVNVRIYKEPPVIRP